MINIIAIVRDVLFIIWLFWNILMVMDGLRYFQVSFYSQFQISLKALDLYLHNEIC